MSNKNEKNIVPPKIGRWLLQIIVSERNRYQAVGDIDEIFFDIVEEKGLFAAKVWYWVQILKSFPSFFSDHIFWGRILFKNYTKIALRNFFRQKTYSVINVAGLAIGVACSILIFLYVQFELSYDSYHEDADLIYRVCKSRKTETSLDQFAPNVIEVGPTLKELYPEVVEYGIMGTRGTPRVRYKDKYYIEDRVQIATSGIFNLFNIPFIKGDKKTALERPNTAVITERIVDRYFGDEDPIGKILMLDTLGYEVTAVIENCPANTHNKYSILIYLDKDNMGPWQRPWAGWNGMNYIKFREGVVVEEFESKVRDLPHKYIGEELRKNNIESTIFLQNVQDIHLHSNLKWEAETPGNPTYVYIFGAVGIFILLLACINFMNLSTARSAKRSGEVGIRKVIGARRSQLIMQFMSESFFMTLFAVIIAIGIVTATLESFNTFVESEYSLSEIFSPGMLLFLIGLLSFVTVVAGGYPALFLSRFNPSSVLGGKLSSGAKGLLMRKIFVIGQFSISLILIIGTIIFYNQMNYMLNQHLGFDKEQKVVLEFNRHMLDLDSYEALKNEFTQHHSIKSASFSSSVPGRWMYLWHMWPHGMQSTKDRIINCFQVDYDFLDDYKIQILEGRGFDETKGIDRPGGPCLLNEAAVREYGWTNNEALNYNMNSENSPIIGVMKDFHFRGLQEEIGPLLVFLMTEDFRYLTLTINTDNLNETLSFVEDTYKHLCPDELFIYFFLDQDFNSQYKSEQKLGSIFGIFTFLGIFIACLGLFGLAAFLAEQRTKEIGVRKVMGATIPGIIFLLNKEFIKWIVISNLIAWPAAYFGIKYWLQNFAYRVEIEISTFIIAAVAALVIALITVSYQSYKAASSNPANSLKYE